MKNLISMFVLSILSVAAYGQTDVIGIWNTGDQNTLVEIQEENGKYVGKVLSSDNPKVKEGTLILKDILFKKGTCEGKVYAPRRGEWYDTTLEKQNGTLKLEVSLGFFNKTIEWRAEKV